MVKYSYVEIMCGQKSFEHYVFPSTTAFIECFSKTNCVSSGSFLYWNPQSNIRSH